MIVGEYLHSRYCTSESTKILFGYNIPPWLWNAYDKVGFEEMFLLYEKTD